MECVGDLVGRLDVDFADEPPEALRLRPGGDVGVERGSEPGVLAVAGHDDPVYVQEVVVARREPGVVRTLVRLARRDREEKGGDATVLVDDPVVGGLLVEGRKRRLVERTREADELVVQGEDRREVSRLCGSDGVRHSGSSQRGALAAGSTARA